MTYSCQPAPSATTEQLGRHLEFMAAALPSRSNDVETGRKRFAVYASILGGKSNEALAFMARRACETLEWFPSPKQCLDLLAEYRLPPSPAATALIECDRFMHRSFDDWLRGLRDGEPIGDVPDQWCRIAVEQGVLRRLDDGSYASRILYYGPPRPPYEPPPRQPFTFTPPPAPPPPAPDIAGQAGASEGLVP